MDLKGSLRYQIVISKLQKGNRAEKEIRGYIELNFLFFGGKKQEPKNLIIFDDFYQFQR